MLSLGSTQTLTAMLWKWPLGSGRPPVWPELIGTDGAPDVPATREAA